MKVRSIPVKEDERAITNLSYHSACMARILQFVSRYVLRKYEEEKRERKSV